MNFSENQIRLIVAVTGASGSIYAKCLFDQLKKNQNQVEKVAVVMSTNAQSVWQHELGDTSYKDYPFDFYEKMDFNAPFASGSAKYNCMVVVPCSMGTLGRIASGVSNDLTTRAADVILKERRRLILVARETPLNLIHINNMKLISEAGGIICPATPSFYSKPSTLEEIANTVVSRIIDLIGLQIDTYRWGKQ